MKVEAKDGRTAGDKVAFIPSGQIAAGIRLEQGVAVPDCRRDQHQGDGRGYGPGDKRAGGACGQGGACGNICHYRTMPKEHSPPKSANSRLDLLEPATK